MKKIIKYIVFMFLPMAFMFFGQANLTTSVLQAIKVNNTPLFTTQNIMNCKDYLNLTGIILSFLPLGLGYVRSGIINERLVKQQKFMIIQCKEFLIQILKDFVKQNEIDINIRIFIPKKGILLRIRNFYGAISGKPKKIQFVMKNVDGFTDGHIRDGLTFEVAPDLQGLVGVCYVEDKIVFDENLKDGDYNLTDYQKQQISEITFCMCIPLNNERNSIYGIIQLDSSSKIHIPSDKKYELAGTLKVFGRRFGEEMTHLFK